MRVTKEQQSSQNAAGTQAAGVDANLPKQKPRAEQKQSNDQTQKREELTNYEVSSKSIQTTSAGFVIQNLSVAVLINRAALPLRSATRPRRRRSPRRSRRSSSSSPRPPASTGSAATSSRSRSSISSTSSRDLEPAPGPSLVEIVARQTGSIVNAGAIVLVAAMMIWFGVRPG